MLRTITSVLSRGVAWGGFCMASTLLVKTVCPALDQLGRLSPDLQGMQTQFHRLAFAEGTGGDWLSYLLLAHCSAPPGMDPAAARSRASKDYYRWRCHQIQDPQPYPQELSPCLATRYPACVVVLILHRSSLWQGRKDLCRGATDLGDRPGSVLDVTAGVTGSRWKLHRSLRRRQTSWSCFRQLAASVRLVGILA
jgi:hypothetical protein